MDRLVGAMRLARPSALKTVSQDFYEDSMATRSLTATPDGIDQINRTLTDKGWSREDLAKHCECSRQPAVKFCAGKSVSKKLFVSFCKTLGLDWETIAGLKAVETSIEPTEPKTDI
ncbi:MAG: hypothetical protein AAF921_20880, partial [Cyanobacteria bacterium P01_D01_bin.44]